MIAIDDDTTNAIVLEAMIRTLTYVLNTIRRADAEMETDLLSMIDRLDSL